MAGNFTVCMVITQARLHEMFLLRNAEETWLGMRKRQTRFSRYSIVEPGMLLGKLKKTRADSDCVNFNVDIPREDGWKDSVFEAAFHSAGWDLHFPYPPLDENGTAFVCPAAFWETCADDPARLDQEESHFREHTVNMLGEWVKPGAIIYDPACSTGAFLGYVMARCPNYDYVASDASDRMIAMARGRLPHAFVADTQDSRQLFSGCDVVICRFLNHEVMSGSEAEVALTNVASCCKANGKVIVFGHTPVALDLPRAMEKMGAKAVSALGKSVSPYGIFQYYVYELTASVQ
ncbi:MAG: hypothetical protein CPSOU_6544 [uncultured Paraburkholderia sp.]|nr:MAG: hypothetical protein CPSOU_6544 [uncultured Paraburkholderia sp.]